MDALSRRDVVRQLVEDRKDLLVVSGLGSATWDLAAAGDHDLNCYLWGAMGGAVPIGLGLAIARPERPVLVITGDGEMLMGIGSLATAAARAPGNLSVAVLNNGRYGETGMQRAHTALGTDLVKMASGAGFADARPVSDADGVRDFVRSMHACEGPLFADISVRTDDPPRVLPERDGVIIKQRFRAALGVAG